MASLAQIVANRRNAAKSTGPKSAAGKAKSSQNAFRHGLSNGIHVDQSQVKQVADALMGVMGIASEEAHAVAEAQVVATELAARRLKIMQQIAIPHRGLDTLRPELMDALFRHEERANRRKRRLMLRLAGKNLVRTKKRNSAKRSQFRLP